MMALLLVAPVMSLTAGGAAARPNCTFVRASATSPAIRDLHHYQGQVQGHYVCAPTAPARQQLLMFLPGTAPNFYTQVVETAAAAGYHAVGVQWDDAPDMAVVCSKDNSKTTGQTLRSVNCTTNGMLMRLFGRDSELAPPNDVGYTEDTHNCVTGRLTALLRFLSHGETGAGWSQFLDDGANSSSSGGIRWSLVAVGGHSRGSDYPVLLSKMFSIARGLSFGGPGQVFIGTCDGRQPPSDSNCNPQRGFREAAWLSSRPSKIPTGDLYGLVAGYPGDACNQGLPAWRVLGLPGAAPFRNSSVAPRPQQPQLLNHVLGGARQLFDTELCRLASSPHMCMISSVDAPLDKDGRSLLIPVWHYMLTNTHNASAAAVAREAAVNCTMPPL